MYFASDWEVLPGFNVMRIVYPFLFNLFLLCHVQFDLYTSNNVICLMMFCEFMCYSIINRSISVA